MASGKNKFPVAIYGRDSKERWWLKHKEKSVINDLWFSHITSLRWLVFEVWETSCKMNAKGAIFGLWCKAVGLNGKYLWPQIFLQIFECQALTLW